jgi:general secretion pathway protein K
MLTLNKRVKNPLGLLRSQRGMALLISMFALTLMIFIATEVSYDTVIEYTVATQQVQRIKAYYAAKAGLELSLLRVQLYKQAMVSLGDSLGPQKSMLDMIWQFPMSWPPQIPDDKNLKVTEVDKDMIKSSTKESLMEAQYATTISPESGKINLNDLGSELKGIREATKAQVMKIFENENKNNDAFRKKYGTTNLEEVVNNIVDWVTAGSASANGGDKIGKYAKLELKDTNRDFIPPNRPFKTMDEIHMVAGMTDDFYRLLESRVTVYGVQGVNINYASKEVLMSLDQSFSEEAANAVIKRRNDPKEGGPFASGAECSKSFLAFVGPFGVNTKSITDSKILLLCDPEFNFRVTSTGLFQKAKREITVITFDLENLPARLADLLDEQDKQTNLGANNVSTGQSATVQQPATNGQQDPNAKKDTKAKMKAPKGRPTVVYWEET